jgi:hypothetical protein
MMLYLILKTLITTMIWRLLHSLISYHVRDGPVPCGTRVDNDVDGDGLNRRSQFMTVLYA